MWYRLVYRQLRAALELWASDGQPGRYERGAAHLTRLISSDSKARKVKSGRLHPIPA